jgi:hypothetical protein
MFPGKCRISRRTAESCRQPAHRANQMDGARWLVGRWRPTLNSRTVFTLYPPCRAGPDDCRPVPAMIFRRARSASRFTVAQLNFGRESLRTLSNEFKAAGVTRHASAEGRYQRRLTVASRPALSFDICYLIWEVLPCRLAAGSAALERRPAVPRSGDISRAVQGRRPPHHLQHVPTAMNRDSQDTPEVRV